MSPGVDALVAAVRTTLLDTDEWLAVLRIGLGLWWLESWRHKDKKGWFERGTGIAWATSVADKHRWSFGAHRLRRVVAPRPRPMAYVVVYARARPRAGAGARVPDPDRAGRRACCSTSCTSC